MFDILLLDLLTVCINIIHLKLINCLTIILSQFTFKISFPAKVLYGQNFIYCDCEFLARYIKHNTIVINNP